MDTTELVVQAQHGDEGAFASLAVVIGSRLHAIAHRILRDADLADDATQQALLTIWRDLPQLRDPARFDGWAYRLLVRACYAEARKTRRLAPNLLVMNFAQFVRNIPASAVEGPEMIAPVRVGGITLPASLE